MRRFIRLSEHQPNQDRWVAPPHAYLQACNDTLPAREYAIRTDENGFLRTGRELPLGDPPIIILGDSVIENYWINEDMRACAQLEGMLRDSGIAVRVLNGGVSGASTLHLLNVLLSKCIPLNPFGVVLMSGVIDARAVNVYGGMWTTQPDLSPITDPPELPPRNGPDRVKLIRLMQEACKAFGILFATATYPHPGKGEHVANDEARSYGGCCADVRLAMEGCDHLFYDPLHTNEEGCGVMAKSLFEELLPMLRAAPVFVPD